MCTSCKIKLLRFGKKCCREPFGAGTVNKDLLARIPGRRLWLRLENGYKVEMTGKR